MTSSDQHRLADEFRAAMANARMMGAGEQHGVEVACVHVASALRSDDPEFDLASFFAECGIPRPKARATPYTVHMMRTDVRLY